MNINASLISIWKQYENDLPLEIKERGFMYSENNTKSDILISGINPSWRNGAIKGEYDSKFSLQEIFEKPTTDTYFNQIKKIVNSKELNIDYFKSTA